ncbi:MULTISPECIES: hypothetical protein [Bradyrhizobium]|uniref:hypothetical protein n=1 Tax=Bradyrhizobium TaxID=374 RepID=UPI000AF690E6|nr:MULTISPECIES: hypothetical protein [Bradyrhizobium]
MSDSDLFGQTVDDAVNSRSRRGEHMRRSLAVLPIPVVDPSDPWQNFDVGARRQFSGGGRSGECDKSYRAQQDVFHFIWPVRVDFSTTTIAMCPPLPSIAKVGSCTLDRAYGSLGVIFRRRSNETAYSGVLPMKKSGRKRSQAA